MHDPKCEELARHFLPGETREELIEELAEDIQLTVEDWIAGKIAELNGKLVRRALDCPKEE